MQHGNSKTLLSLMHGQRTRYAAAVVAMALATFFLYLSPLLVRTAIDRVVASPSDPALPRRLVYYALAVVGVTACSGLFAYFRGRWVALASESIARNLRNRLYAHLQHLPVTYHDQAQTGDLVQRCTSDVDTLRLFYKEQVIEIARAALLILTVLPILLGLDVTMALLSVSLLPVIVVFAVIFFRRVQSRFKATDEAEGAMTASLQENLTGIRVVRAFARQDFEKERFDLKNAAHRDRHWHLFKLMALYWSSSDLLCFGQMAIVLFAGAHRVARGEMTVGTLVAFLSYSQMYIWPVRQMGRVLSELGKAMVAVHRVHEILEVPEESAPARPASDFPARARGEIHLKGASFSFASKDSAGGTGVPPVSNAASEAGTFASEDGEHGRDARATVARAVLHDINLAIPAGSTIALLGPSGSGKSTLVALLLRLYDYSQGSITLDGVELSEIDRKQLRSQFAVVMQEPFLYSKTLRDNIKLGRPAAADTDMLDASLLASIHDSIESFDQKYDTLVGERGVTLSGGQRQRVAIARAILRDAPILVLDDALSAVDTHTESAILSALKHRRGRHTTIVIAHRLSTLMHADQIAVLDHGRLVQLGTHAELSKKPGLYQRLWQIQGALEEDLSKELQSQPPADSQPTLEPTTEEA